MTTTRFHIAEIEDAEGLPVEWIVSDAENEYDPCSYDSEEAAAEAVEILTEEVKGQ